jgi:hypothetical protein
VRAVSVGRKRLAVVCWVVRELWTEVQNWGLGFADWLGWPSAPASLVFGMVRGLFVAADYPPPTCESEKGVVVG